jgi:hypothetical protein
MFYYFKLLIGVLISSLMWCGAAQASPAVWSGLGVTFSKTTGADPTLPQNQDRVTSHVWLTRGDTGGLYNAVLESSYDKVARTAPADTEWATDLNNPGQTIAAANWPALSFTSWSAAYGGHVGLTIVGLDAVAYLITDNVYLDVRVTDWNGGESGGGFTYLRAAAPAASGDYNHDGIVDSADYTLWRDTFGQTVPLGTGADGNLSGTIDAGDYASWKSRFGLADSGGASTAAVPEAESRALAIIGIVIVATNWRSCV